MLLNYKNMKIQIKMSIWLHKQEWITKRTFSINKLKSSHLNLKGITSPVVCLINLSNNTLRATYLPKNEDVLLASRFTHQSKGNNHYNSTSNLFKGTLMQTWKSPYMFVFKWKQYPENFTFLFLGILKLLAHKVCKFLKK